VVRQGAGRLAFVQDSSHRLDAAFLTAAAVALDLVERREVGEQWVMPSVLPKMSVGALACHLGRQVVRAAALLPVVTDVPPLEHVDEHYRRADWVKSTSPDDPPNDRSTDDAEAVLGAAALADRTAEALETVRRLFADGAARDVVLIPWQGWALRRDDFLLTRMLEIVVHADDLALSVGIRMPEFPAQVFAPVRDLLVRLAVDRHGQSAVISTLTRSERTQPISAF
jgi:Mycothiol maleylpyruvate isomerase N-terminal domain